MNIMKILDEINKNGSTKIDKGELDILFNKYSNPNLLFYNLEETIIIKKILKIITKIKNKIKNKSKIKAKITKFIGKIFALIIKTFIIALLFYVFRLLVSNFTGIDLFSNIVKTVHADSSNITNSIYTELNETEFNKDEIEQNMDENIKKEDNEKNNKSIVYSKNIVQNNDLIKSQHDHKSFETHKLNRN